MTTAFVLGGGGALGAVEVGMLRALLERGIVPDLVLGTSVGALNGAMVARDPSPAVVDRLTDLWQAAAGNSREVYGDRPLRTVRRAVSTGTNLFSAKPLEQRLADELGDVTFEELPVRFQVCAASIERAAEHWFDTGRVVDAVVASAAVPGLLPPARVGDEHYLDGGIVNSVPVGRAARLGATRIFVLQVGRVDRPLEVPRRPWEVARVSFEIARRHRFHRELAELPDGVTAHVLPARGTSARDDSLRAGRDFRGVQRRIDATYDATSAYLDALPRDGAGPADPGDPGVTWLLRRLVVAPAVVGLTVVVWLTLPLWLIVTAALSPLLPGRWRALRLLWVLILYLTCESVTLVVMLGLWLASGCGWRMRTPYFEGIHYDLVQGVMWVFFREARRVLRLRIVTDGPSPDAHPGRPLVVACRHAGPGDSFTLVHALMHWYDREPRVVLKDTLAWDPMIDVVLRRIPARFISPSPGRGEDLESEIAALASGLDEDDAFVIFPEGGNFTPERRQRAIDRLRRLGMERMARRAEAMTNVLAPKPGGLIAALDAAPDADVVLVAHTGLDHLASVADLWRELPMDKQIIMRWWRVPRPEIPAGREERIDWLYGWWERIDAWVQQNRPEEISSGRS